MLRKLKSIVHYLEKRVTLPMDVSRYHPHSPFVFSVPLLMRQRSRPLEPAAYQARLYCSSHRDHRCLNGQQQTTQTKTKAAARPLGHTA